MLILNQGVQNRRPDKAWKKLDRLVCGPMTLSLLGLRCPTGLVMIDQCSEYSKGDLMLALCENPIPRLKLSLMLTPGYVIRAWGSAPIGAGDVRESGSRGHT